MATVPLNNPELIESIISNLHDDVLILLGFVDKAE